MRRTMITTLGLIAGLGASLGAQDKQPPAPSALRAYEVPLVQTFTLNNGMRVLLVERHTLPVVSARFIVDAGAMREPAEKNGLGVLTGDLLSEGEIGRAHV